LYCIIQKITNKLPSSDVWHKELLMNSTKVVINGVTRIKYLYEFRNARFDRPIRDTYKISIHESYRDKGKVKKKQWYICTIGYYDMLYKAVDHYALALDEKLTQMGISEKTLWDMINSKLKPILDNVIKEFKATEEYKTIEEQKKVINMHIKNKKTFEDKHGQDTYDYCYDVLGVLRNEMYLKELQYTYDTKQKEKGSNYGSESKNSKNYDYSSYSDVKKEIKKGNYTEKDKVFLKKIYKALAMSFHPDRYNGDEGETMKFINRLKEDWDI
jgi:hypothetical protein